MSRYVAGINNRRTIW